MARPAATARKRATSSTMPAPKVAATKAAATKSNLPRGARSAKLLSPQWDSMPSEQKVAHLLADRETLVARIATLEAEVGRLSSTQQHVAERIAWTLDSLRELIGKKG